MMLPPRLGRLLPRLGHPLRSPLLHHLHPLRCPPLHPHSNLHSTPQPPQNDPLYTPLLQEVEHRREEAGRSILVQVAGESSAPDLASYCHQVFGPVEGLYFHNNTHGKFRSFYIVQFAASSSVEAVLRLAQHQQGDCAASSPVPVYSPFLWLAGKPGLHHAPAGAAPLVHPQQESGKRLVEWARGEEDVSQQMVLLWRSTMMSEVSTRLRYLLGRQLELALAGLFPRAQVLPFGSSVNGFGSSSSDQDMCLVLDPPRPAGDTCRLVFHAKGGAAGERAQVQRHCEEVAKIVQSFLPGCQNVEKVLHARVPIIKYSQQFAGLECDLSMSSTSGLYMSCLLHLWAGLDWRVRPLVAVVRQWARAQGLVKDIRPTHFFTNFTLTLLVVCFLQQRHQMLPSLDTLAAAASDRDVFYCEDNLRVSFLHDVSQRKPEFNKCFHSTLSLQELLHDFFHFCTDFDFGGKCLCPITGTSIPKDRCWSKSSAMDMINPLETDLNVSYNVNRQAVGLLQRRSGAAAAAMDRGVTSIFDLMDVSAERGKRRDMTTNVRKMDLFTQPDKEEAVEASPPADLQQAEGQGRAQSPGPAQSSEKAKSPEPAGPKHHPWGASLDHPLLQAEAEAQERNHSPSRKGKGENRPMHKVDSERQQKRLSLKVKDLFGGEADQSSKPEVTRSSIHSAILGKEAATLSSEALRIERLKAKYLRSKSHLPPELKL